MLAPAEVVASQWAVEDRVTARFMELFHASLARDVPAPEALRTARRTLRTERDARGLVLAHSCFWAAWVVQR